MHDFSKFVNFIFICIIVEIINNFVSICYIRALIYLISSKYIDGKSKIWKY